MAGRVVQQDEPPAADLGTVTLYGREDRVRVGRQPGRRAHLLEDDLRPRPHCTEATHGLSEDGGHGGRGRHVASVWRGRRSWGHGTPARRPSGVSRSLDRPECRAPTYGTIGSDGYPADSIPTSCMECDFPTGGRLSRRGGAAHAGLVHAPGRSFVARVPGGAGRGGYGAVLPLDRA